MRYRKKLEVKRSKKWKSVREKSGSNSKQNASSNAPNVDKNSILLNVSHKNQSHCCHVREMVSEANWTVIKLKMRTPKRKVL